MSEMINTNMGMSHLGTGAVGPDVMVPQAHLRDVGLIPMKFERVIYEHIGVDANGRPNGKIEPREAIFVELVKKGERGSTIRERVERYERGKGEEDRLIWALIKPYYEAWLKGEELPVDGTPLACWPISPGQATKLRSMHLLTVESVSTMTDGDCDHFGMGGRGLRDAAKAFLSVQGKGAAIQRERELQDTLAKQSAELAELRTLLEQRTAPADEPEEVRRGPGRLRKDAA